MTIAPIEFAFPSLGVSFSGPSTFHYHQDFGRHCISDFSCTIEDNRATAFRAAIQSGAKIQLLLNGRVQMTANILQLKSNGSTITFSGKDLLGNLGDLDCRLRFRKGMSIKAVVEFVFKSVGFPSIAIDGDDALNSLGILGGSADDSPPPKSELGAISVEQIKIKEGVSVTSFLDRFLGRFGLYVWAKADGTGLVIAKPTYNNSNRAKMVRRLDGIGNTVEEGSSSIDIADQPMDFISLGHGKGSGDEDHPRLKCYSVNPLLGTDSNGSVFPSITTLISDPNWKGIQEVKTQSDLAKYRYLFGDNAEMPLRSIIMKDKQANTQKEMVEFNKRKLGEMMATLFTLNYTISGHAQGETPFAVNQMVDVNDEFLDVDGSFWVKSRTFTQSVHDGTKTQLECILPYCY